MGEGSEVSELWRQGLMLGLLADLQYVTQHLCPSASPSAPLDHGKSNTCSRLEQRVPCAEEALSKH